MGLRSWLPALLALAVPPSSAPALAEDATIVETVEGYQIKRIGKPSDPKPCQMVRGYADPTQPNSDKALFFAQLDRRIVVTVAYERWNWTAGKPPQVKFRIDDQTYSPSSAWYGAQTGLGAQFTDTLVTKLNQGNRIVVGLKDGTVDFELAGFKPAYEAVQRCNAGTREAPPPARDGVSTIAEAGKSLESEVETSPKAAADPVPAKQSAASPPEPSPASPYSSQQPAATDAQGPGEARAVAYVLARYEQWALQHCEVGSTAKQRAAVEARVSDLRPEMQALEPVLSERFKGLDAQGCPPSEVLEKHLAILAESSPEEAVARMDGTVRKEMLGIVRPLLSRSGTASVPGDARIAAFLAGLIIEGGLERCDIATTGKQRAAIAEKLAALRKEMSEIETELGESAKRQPCPPGGDADAQQAVALFIDKTPEGFVEEWDAKRGGALLKVAKELSARLRPPPHPPQPRIAAYLYGLVLRDVIEECDIRTTAKQRAGFEERMASLKPEMQALEQALLQQKGPFKACPPRERIADMEAGLALFVESAPDDFAAEMDRRSKEKKAEAASPPPVPAIAAKAICGFRQGPAQFQSYLKSQIPALSAFKAAEIQSASAGGGETPRIAYNGPDHAGGAPDIMLTLPNPAESEATFTIVGVLRSDQIESATAAIAGAVAALFEQRQPVDALTLEIGNHFDSRSPAGHSWRRHFGGTALVLKMGADATVTITVDGYGSVACGP